MITHHLILVEVNNFFLINLFQYIQPMHQQAQRPRQRKKHPTFVWSIKAQHTYHFFNLNIISK